MSDIEKLCLTLCEAGVTVTPHPDKRKVLAAGRIYTYDKQGRIIHVQEV